MIDPNLNVTPKQVRHFGLMLIPFAAALGGLALWRGNALVGAAIFLSGAWLISLIFNNENRTRQLLGVILPALCAGIGLPIRYGTDAMTIATIVWIIVGTIALGVVFVPSFGRTVYDSWMLAAVPISWAVSHLILGIVYYLVLTPIGLIMRLCGRDPMHRQLLPETDTYWKTHKPRNNDQQYFHQF